MGHFHFKQGRKPGKSDEKLEKSTFWEICRREWKSLIRLIDSKNVAVSIAISTLKKDDSFHMFCECDTQGLRKSFLLVLSYTYVIGGRNLYEMSRMRYGERDSGEVLKTVANKWQMSMSVDVQTYCTMSPCWLMNQHESGKRNNNIKPIWEYFVTNFYTVICHIYA